MKTFKGKAIYNPSGKAGEYSYWACNFYTGCSNDCAYCYCKRGVLASTWSTTPKLKSCFKDENHALEIFEKELKRNLPELQKHGLFFSFTTDPMLPETKLLTMVAVHFCMLNSVNMKILTKRADWIDWALAFPYKITFGEEPEKTYYLEHFKNHIAWGFTLTGHDELEPNASTNAERIEAMRKLHNAGFKTWASIEPMIDITIGLDIIKATAEFCDLYKIGLLSGGKYKSINLHLFVNVASAIIERDYGNRSKIYFKDSLLEKAEKQRKYLPSNCVGRDYNIFNDKKNNYAHN